MIKQPAMISFLMVLVLLMQACTLPIGASNGGDELNPAQNSSSSTDPSPETTDNSTDQQDLLVPASGSEPVSSGHDNEESGIASLKTIQSGEDFEINRFERPFTSTDMAYIPDVDIKDFSMTKDENYYYVQIALTGANPNSNILSGHYGVELDLNMDGRADFLIFTKSTLTSDWSREGVAVYYDSNGDVGGLRVIRADENYTGNGFDLEVFDSGKGLETDLAWARSITGGGRNIAEIAFKPTLLESYQTFLWSVVASVNEIEPSMFYYSDSITKSAAGSPEKGNKDYPLKELSGFDNTCRIPVGFKATGKEPLGCLVKGPSTEPQPQPTVPPPGGKG